MIQTILILKLIQACSIEIFIRGALNCGDEIGPLRQANQILIAEVHFKGFYVTLTLVFAQHIFKYEESRVET